MRPFAYAATNDPRVAIATVAQDANARFLAGGTNIVDLMKDDVEAPAALIDINALPYDRIERTASGIRIGALARMNDVADHPDVQKQAPAIAQALQLSASAQLRNMASMGGNILQRTRCAYFRDTATACNKRAPGQGCTAIGGENRQHAILGASERCICTHPSDFAVAFLALDGVVQTTGPNGSRTLPAAGFHVLPNADPAIETVLQHGELITALDVPSSPIAASSTYLKIRDRESYQFALVSVAAGLDIATDGTIRGARIALGGVAPIPWRAKDAEAMLVGNRPSAALYERVAQTAVRGAKGQGKNDFKIVLAQRSVVRALHTVRGVA
jgi:xanthine dehydrogenase YagS FAD-binding subunit